jgi:hypothetical protein
MSQSTSHDFILPPPGDGVEEGISSELASNPGGTDHTSEREGDTLRDHKIFTALDLECQGTKALMKKKTWNDQNPNVWDRISRPTTAMVMHTGGVNQFDDRENHINWLVEELLEDWARKGKPNSTHHLIAQPPNCVVFQSI